MKPTLSRFTASLALTLALSGAAWAAAPSVPSTAAASTANDEVLPPEVLKAIDAVNQAARQTGKAMQGAAQKTGSAMNEVAGQVSQVTNRAQEQIDTIDPHALAIGLGAIGGVVAFNVITGGMGTLPLMASAGGAATAAESTVAVSRVYAVTSAVVGGLAGDYVYRKNYSGAVPSVPAGVAKRVTP